ncbi:MAG: hypothetical protein AAF363_14175 [Bacteroidota bacterium]
MKKQNIEKIETLTSKELGFLMDTDFLVTKSQLIKKMESILSETEQSLVRLVQSSGYKFPEKTLIKAGKISKGENYRLLPYLVLDYPRLSTKENLFLYRTIFWWGHYFSFTLQMEGHLAQNVLQKLIHDCSEITGKNLLLYSGMDRWCHDLGDPGYISIDTLEVDDLKKILSNLQFLKISAKSPLEDYTKVEENSTQYLKLFAELLSH